MSPELKEYLDRLNGVTTQLSDGQKIQAAQQPEGKIADAGDAEIINKAVTRDPYEAKFAAFGHDELSKSFLRLAQLDNKQFGHLGVDAVLANPRGFLRAKHGPEAGEFLHGQYVVPDAALETMIHTLLRQKVNPSMQKSVNDMQDGTKVADALYMSGNDVIKRALDVTSGAALIREDLDQLIREAYLRDFPALEQFRTMPANGIVHTYNRRTAVGTAVTIDDLGDMSGSFSNSTYTKHAQAHIATIISPRAIGLKFQFAVQQSGMNFNVQGDNNLEIMGAMTAISKKVQAMLLQGNYTDAAKTLDDEEGLTDANGFDGVRALLKGGATSITKATSESYTDVINRAVGQIINAGGSSRSLMLLMSLGARFQVNLELQGYLRVLKEEAGNGAFPTNLSANGLVTLNDWLTRMINVPADAQNNGVGHYTFGGNTVEDISVLDVSTWGLAYLGSATPSILELPIGFNNQLSQVYYPFYMVGLVGFIQAFNRKIRVPRLAL